LLPGVQRFFFPQFCDVAEVVIIHKDDLARFGYILDMKVEKKFKTFYNFGYLLKLLMKIWRFDFYLCRNLANLGTTFFSMKNP